MARKIMKKSKLKKEIGVINVSAPWNYRPWICSREMYDGNGRRHVINDLKYPERQIHLFSDLEYAVYHLLRQSPRVVELFEQVPLNQKETLKISREFGITHPRVPGEGLAVMTTDFLAVIKGRKGLEYRAYSVKFQKELEDRRTLEKLKIEQYYWENNQVSWVLFTEKELETELRK